MNTRFGLTTWCTLVLLFFFANSATAEIELYDFPTSAPRATDLEVAVDGQPVFVYDTKVAAISTFGIAAKAKIRIQRKEPFEKCIVRPLSANIVPRMNGRVFSTRRIAVT